MSIPKWSEKLALMILILIQKNFRGYFQWSLCTPWQAMLCRSGLKRSKMIRKTWIILVALRCFCFQNFSVRNNNVLIFLYLKESLEAAFNEKRTSRKYLTEKCMWVVKWLENQIFLVALLYFYFRILPSNIVKNVFYL